MSLGLRTIVVIFTKFSISMPAARSCTCKLRHDSAHCASASSGTLPSAGVARPVKYPAFDLEWHLARVEFSDKRKRRAETLRSRFV